MSPVDAEAVGFRLSPQQELLLAPGRPPEITQCAVLLDGPIDADRLREALAELAGRHEILRTTFAQPPGMLALQQMIGEEPGQAWSLELRPGADALIADREALDGLLADEATHEQDLAHGAPLRALLIGGEEPEALLVLSACAACADATSLPALVGELCESYGGADGAQEPVQYADYAQWRHELLAGEEPDAQEGLHHWREAASARPAPPRILFARTGAPAGGPDTSALPELSATAPPEPTASAPLALEGIALVDLQRAAVGAGADAAVLLEAAWHALLARVTGARELTLAGWCDGRAQPELAGAVGPYEQPAPIHSSLQEATTFAEVVDQVRRTRATAARFQDCGAADDLAATAGQAPAGWAFHAVGALPAPARGLLALRVPGGGTRLTLAVHLQQGALRGQVQYDPATVPAEDARELARRFVTLLGSALADPSAPVARLAIADEPERARLVAAAGPQDAGRPQAPPDGAVQPQAPPGATGLQPMLVHELLEHHAQLTPERLAVADSAQAFTYAELDAAANRLAHHLHALGPARGQAVGLCMERRPAMLVALMAILKAGGAYLPLNFEYPPARVERQLRDAGVEVIVSEEHVLEHLPPFAGTVVCVDRDAEAIAARPAERPEPRASAADRAYVMYTSGSTGTPKGVAVTHGNIANYAASIAARLSASTDPAPSAEGVSPVPDGDPSALVYGVVSAISTDLGNTSIFAPLVHGGAVRLIGAEASTDGELLAQDLGGERLDVLKIAPSHLRALLAAGTVQALPTRWLVVGGEALTWELVEQVRALAPGCRILNHYGPTETTVGCLTYEVDEQRREDSATVPIGRPLHGVGAHVLDGLMEPVPAGVPGELCVTGAGVASGYLGEHDGGGFTRDPFAPGADAGATNARETDTGTMYRTGDRVRRLRDGAIEFLGRVDDQVKIRGFRVEPGEVEAALLRHDAIRQAAVCAEGEDVSAQRLVAYVVAREELAVEPLRAFLAETLPEHMIPAAFRVADALPLNASGKVDRGALAGLAELAAQREADFLAPRDEIERQIAEIWGELLGVERVGVHDDFFALGGHSLLATQATMRIRRLYGDIPLRALLAAPTVAALADVVREQVNAEQANAGQVDAAQVDAAQVDAAPAVG